MVTSRVEAIDSPSQNRNGCEPGGKRCSMGGGIDSIGTARDNRDVEGAKLRDQLARDPSAVVGGTA
jgi:hypothetical protein